MQKRGSTLYIFFIPVVLFLFGFSIIQVNPLKSIFTDDGTPGGFVLARVGVGNDLGGELEDLQVSVIGLDIDIYGFRTNFDLRGKERVTKALFLDVPNNVQPGNYWIKVTLSNEEFKRHTFREITIV